MSGTMSVDKQRFEQLENTVVDIDKRMIPIELAVPSIDQSLKELVKITHQQQIDRAVQDEKNKKQDERSERLESAVKQIQTSQSELGKKVDTNDKKLIKITMAIGIILVVVAKISPDMQWILSTIKP